MSEHDDYEKFRKFTVSGMICELISATSRGIYSEVGIGVTPVDRTLIQIRDPEGNLHPWPEQYEYTPEFLHHLTGHLMLDFRFNYYMTRLYNITPIHINSIGLVRPLDDDDEPILGDYAELDDAPEIMLLVMGIQCNTFSKLLNEKFGIMDRPYSHMQFGSISTVDMFLNYVDGETGKPDETDTKWGWFTLSHEVLESTKLNPIMPSTPAVIHLKFVLNNYKELAQYKPGLNLIDFHGLDHVIRTRLMEIVTGMLFPYRGMNLELASEDAGGRWLTYYYTENSGPFTESELNVCDVYVACFFHPKDVRWFENEPDVLTCRFEGEGHEKLAYGLGISRRTSISRALSEPLHSYLNSTPDVMCISTFSNAELCRTYDMEAVRFHMIPGYLQMGTGLVFDNPECKGQPDMYCAVMRNGNTTIFVPIISRRLEFSGIFGFMRADCADGDYVPVLVQTLIDKNDNLSWEISSSGTCLMGRITLPSVRYISTGPHTEVMEWAGHYFCPSVIATNAEIAAMRVEPPLHPHYDDPETTVWNYFCAIANCCNLSTLYARLAISGETRDSFILRCIEMWRIGTNIDFDGTMREAYMNAMKTFMAAKRAGVMFGLTYARTKELIEEVEKQYREPVLEKATPKEEQELDTLGAILQKARDNGAPTEALRLFTSREPVQRHGAFPFTLKFINRFGSDKAPVKDKLEIKTEGRKDEDEEDENDLFESEWDEGIDD